jgi:tight adherence protein B
MRAAFDSKRTSPVGATLFIFVTVSVGIIAGYHLLAGLLWPDVDRVRSRLAREFDPARNDAASSPLFKNVAELDLELDAAPVESDLEAPASAQLGLRAQLEAMVTETKLPLSLQQLALVAVGLGLASGLVGIWLGGALIGLPAAVAAALAPLAYLHVRVKGRRDKLLRQLPPAFELMARVLRAGGSVPQALQAISDAFEDPIAGEFAHCQRQLDLGLRPEVIYQEMARRSGIIEMRIFVMAMVIQRQTGGNLSEVLDRLATLIRGRLRQRQQVRTLTAEGRMQGWVLTLLPVFIFGVMLVINRDYAMVLLDHVPLLIATGCSMLLGMTWIRSIVNFDV